MKFLFLLLLCQLALAEAPEQWSAAQKIVDRHEFYKDDEAIVKPKGSWEVLFSVTYPSKNLRSIKDCVFYHVPGLDQAELRVRTVPASVTCDMKSKALQEISKKDLSAVTFSASANEAKLNFKLSNGKSESWSVGPLQTLTQAKPKLLESSAEYRSPKTVYLSKFTDDSAPTLLKDQEPCFKVSDLCESKETSQCHLCANGWYEIPNGCAQGPKFCGSINCGGKNEPACRRGTHYQRRKAQFECRRDASFAYCQRGLTIQCEGSLAYCR